MLKRSKLLFYSVSICSFLCLQIQHLSLHGALSFCYIFNECPSLGATSGHALKPPFNPAYSSAWLLSNRIVNLFSNILVAYTWHWIVLFVYNFFRSFRSHLLKRISIVELQFRCSSLVIFNPFVSISTVILSFLGDLLFFISSIALFTLFLLIFPCMPKFAVSIFVWWIFFVLPIYLYNTPSLFLIPFVWVFPIIGFKHHIIILFDFLFYSICILSCIFCCVSFFFCPSVIHLWLIICFCLFRDVNLLSYIFFVQFISACNSVSASNVFVSSIVLFSR